MDRNRKHASRSRSSRDTPVELLQCSVILLESMHSKRKNRSDGRCRNSRPRTPPREMVCRFHWELTHPPKEVFYFSVQRTLVATNNGVSTLTSPPIEPKPQPRGPVDANAAPTPASFLSRRCLGFSFTRRHSGWVLYSVIFDPCRRETHRRS